MIISIYSIKIICHLLSIEVKIEDEDKALILFSLPPSYEHLVTTLPHGK